MRTNKRTIIQLVVICFFIFGLKTVIAGEVTYPDNGYSSGDTLNASSLNNKFNEIKAGVNDNDGRITTNAADIVTNISDIVANDARVTELENRSPTTGRFVVPVKTLETTGSGTITADLYGTYAPLATGLGDKVYSAPFAKPADYISGTVTFKAVLSGCDGFDIVTDVVQPRYYGIDIGTNNSISLVLFCLVESCPVVSVPSSSAGTFSVVSVDSTTSSLKDINTISFIRYGSHASDTCPAALQVRGFIVEYPRG